VIVIVIGDSDGDSDGDGDGDENSVNPAKRPIARERSSVAK
jgi:hypothetical protein